MYSDLLKTILENAEKTRVEHNLNYVSPLLVIGECSEFCSKEYNGLKDYFEKFEEERLRYVYKKVFKLSRNIKPKLIKILQENNLDAPFEFSKSQEISISRNKSLISADLAFLEALSACPKEHLFCSAEFKGDFDIFSVVSDVDKNIYDYVIEKSTKLRDKFQARIDEATALRDWRPKKKFSEPLELQNEFFSNIKTEYSKNVLKLTVPCFFDSSPLTLSIHFYDNAYYVEDNGSAIKFLKKRVKDNEKQNKILNKLCHPQHVKGQSITGCFTSAHTFMYYVQRVIFIANGDRFYSRLSSRLYLKDNEYIDASFAENFDYEALLNTLKQSFSFDYNENLGLYICIRTKYSTFSSPIGFVFEVLDDNKIKISDKYKGNVEHEIFEAFYWGNDSLTPYEAYIKKLASNLGAVFENNNLYLCTDSKNWIQGFFKFINVSLVFSEFGGIINLPKPRK